MKSNFKNNVALLLLMVFLLPSIVKMEHHHENFVCKAKHDTHYHNYHEKCSICDFNFSVFSKDHIIIGFKHIQPIIDYKTTPISFNYENLCQYSFLLRAPPFIQN